MTTPPAYIVPDSKRRRCRSPRKHNSPHIHTQQKQHVKFTKIHSTLHKIITRIVPAYGACVAAVPLFYRPKGPRVYAFLCRTKCGTRSAQDTVQDRWRIDTHTKQFTVRFDTRVGRAQAWFASTAIGFIFLPVYRPTDMATTRIAVA